jgi:hypothetical protein
MQTENDASHVNLEPSLQFIPYDYSILFWVFHFMFHFMAIGIDILTRTTTGSLSPKACLPALQRQELFISWENPRLACNNRPFGMPVVNVAS